MPRNLQLRSRWKEFRGRAKAVGVRAALEYSLQHRLARWSGPEYLIHPRNANYPLAVRRNSSDIDVFHQVFIEQQYECVGDMMEARLIVDCGANVGYSSAFFLSRYPQCHVVAIEPDQDNYRMMQRNLAPYGSCVRALNAAVWSSTAALVMAENSYGDGRAWSRQVRPCRPNEQASIEAVDIESVLRNSGYNRLSILKIDVEGAEAEIFAGNCEWLERVDAIVIELHDDSVFGNGSSVFLSAIKGKGFHVSRSGELTVCRRIN